MRYIGNKTKLLPFIGELLDCKRIQPVRAFDAFSGTAAVGRFLKARGASVVSCDLMQFSLAFQRAYIVADVYPRFSALADDPDVRRVRVRADFKARVDQRVGARMAAAVAAAASTAPPSETRPMDEVLVYLDSYLDPHRSFISQHFAAPSDGHDFRDSSTIANGDGPTAQHDKDSHATLQRMYFTMPVAGRIDAIRERLHGWHEQGVVSDDEYYLLLAALLEAADAVANTAGIYAAYIKQWQPNALRDLRLRVPWIIARAHRPGVRSSRPCEAYCADVSEIAPRSGRFDLLYLDPPYNTRQYSGYYHIPELIARGWFDELPVLRGKTGLPLGGNVKSAWSARGQCVAALEQLIETVDADHVVLSYNSEGIIPDEEIERIFRRAGRPRSFARVAREYQRYRSDNPGPTRRYKAHSVREQLYYVRLGRSRARADARR